MISFKKATRKEIRNLSSILLKMLENKDSKTYQENVAKFGIPAKYAREAFSEENLLKAFDSGKSVFYLAMENNCDIAGFIQVIKKDVRTVELDRVMIFPQYSRKGIGTGLLQKVVREQKQKGTNEIIVCTGREEEGARRFYEKNGFTAQKESTADTPWDAQLRMITYQLVL